MRLNTQHLALTALLALALALAGCGRIETSCATVGNVKPLCGVQMPEDIEVLPNEGGLLIAEYGHNGELTGDLVWYQPGPEATFVALVTNDNITTGAGELWGSADCAVPDKLSPHGIHLSKRGATHQLLVVNHSSYEQVLFYEVKTSSDPQLPPALEWRGCVTFPEYAVLNDVAAVAGAGFAVTHMYNRESQAMAQFKSLLGINKGHVWLWYPGKPATILPNSSARLPNGIEVADDGRSVWVNNYIDQQVKQHALPSGEVLAAIHVPNIDNSAWLPDGRLLQASHKSPMGMMPCFGVTEGTCAAGYELIAVDTATGTSETLFSSSKGELFGPATVAVQYKGKLYAGSFSGDRLAEITLQQ